MRIVTGWKKARPVLEAWRKKLTTVQVSLKTPRAVDITPIDFAAGEPVAPADPPKEQFRAVLIYFTRDDVTLRRPSGALLVLDTYELEWVADGKTRVVF